jgi:hypothetical protein
VQKDLQFWLYNVKYMEGMCRYLFGGGRINVMTLVGVAKVIGKGREHGTS